ncbi:hypothetical protein J2X10_002753 [Pseudomonas peli]|nr:hypothetical protein [Pseudomonas peli]
MKSLIDAIGRERASTLMEQAVADAIRDNQRLGLSKLEQHVPRRILPDQGPSSVRRGLIA